MSDFDKFIEEVKNGLVEIAKTEAKDFTEQVTSAGETFLETIKSDLHTWAIQYAEGKLSETEFKSLLRGAKSLGKIEKLTQAGLAKTRIDRIRVALIDLIITAAGKLV